MGKKLIIYGCGHREEYGGESDYFTPKYLICSQCLRIKTDEQLSQYSKDLYTTIKKAANAK